MVADEKSTADQWVGRTIAGKYRVDSLLGKGGMGLVLRARHLRLDEDVAIKVLLPSMLEVPGMVTRFVREARAASKIKSVHVVRVTDVDVLEDGVPYMVMELLEGVSIAALRRREGTFSVEQAVRLLLEACDAIAEAHSLGIVHRDLKPANLFLASGRDGMTSLKVLDFGISKVDAPGEHDTTKTGQMMGSPKYMAPEQMLSMHDVDARADVWSLGAILYDMLTGRTPFVADTVAQLCSAVLHDKPPPPRQFRPDLPEELETAIMTCLQRDRVDRFRDVAALAAAIAPFAPASPSPAFLLGALRRASSVPGRVDDTPTVHTPPSTTAATAPVAAPSATSAATSSVAPPSRSASLVWQDTPQQPEPTRRRFRVAAVVAMAAALGGVLVLVVLRGRARDQLVIQPALAATAPGGGEVVAALAPPTSKPDVAQPPPPPVAVTSSDAQPAPSPAPVAPSSKPVAPPSPSAGPSTRAPVKRGPAPADPRPSPDSDPFGGKRK